MNKTTVLVLSKEQYEKLEDSLPKPYVGDKTTGEQASFYCGVQYVLKLLRDGFTVDV